MAIKSNFASASSVSTLQTQVSGIDTKVGNLVALSGVAANSANLGSFTGSIISNNNTVKGALQELETELETVGAASVANRIYASFGSTTGTGDHNLVVQNITKKSTGNFLMGVERLRKAVGDSTYNYGHLQLLTQTAAGISFNINFDGDYIIRLKTTGNTPSTGGPFPYSYTSGAYDGQSLIPEKFTFGGYDWVGPPNSIIAYIRQTEPVGTVFSFQAVIETTGTGLDAWEYDSIAVFCVEL